MGATTSRRTHPHLLAACLALTSACEPEASPTKAAPPAPPKQGLSINDKPIETRSTLAIGTEGETSWRVTVASDALGCEALTDSYPDRPPTAPGTRLDFWLVRAMNPDGSLGEWSVRSSYITDGDGGRGITTRGAMLEAVSHAGDVVKVQDVDLACSDGTRELAFNGSILAKSCGRVKLPVEARPQPDLALTLAGAPYPVNGATVRPIGKRFHLRLSRAPHQCSSVFTEGFDSYIDIVLDDDPPRVAFASLAGDAFPDNPSGSKGKQAFRIATDESLAGTTAADIEVEGQLDLTGYALTVKGKVNALRCTPKPTDGPSASTSSHVSAPSSSAPSSSAPASSAPASSASRP